MTARLQGWLAKGLGACALGALLLAPGAAAAKPAKRSHANRAVRAPRAPVEGLSFGAFTPAAADPKLAAAFARSGLGAGNFSGGAFRFTPAGAGGRRAVTVAVRAHVVTHADAAKTLSVPAALAPAVYNLGVAVGWKHFAISGDVSKLQGGLLPEGREAADIGVSYSGGRWATKLELAADRATGDRPTLFGMDQSWSVDVGGSYAVTRNLDVTGGVRYKERRDQLTPSLTGDARNNSQAVYLGTAFRF